MQVRIQTIQVKLYQHRLVIFIFFAGFILRLVMASADPFLHPWDERFHALVARNMMHDPFVPMLHANPVTGNFDPNMWCCNHIWLHKQPLFMWQMALSMKIFGVSEIALRLPSVLMGSIAILLLYRIAFIFSNSNKQLAIIAASLLACSNFHLQLIAGIHGMDHNDTAHSFYILASLWAFSEFIKRRKTGWLIAIGFLAGCAVLNKWLTGLLVFFVWGVYIFSNIERIVNKKEWLYYGISLIVCVITFLPWQIYILSRFPAEARFEFAFNARHLTEAIEGHSGPFLYYWNQLPQLIGALIYWSFIPGMIIATRKLNTNKQLLYPFIAAIVFVFLFFSFVASKVDSYFFMVVPLCFLFVAVAVDYVISIAKQKILQAVIVIFSLLLVLNPVWINEYFSSQNHERNERKYNAEIYKNIKNYMPAGIKVVMNVNAFEDKDLMFYHNDLSAYHWTLPEKDMEELARKKIPVAVFAPHGNYNLPEHILRYPYLFIIQKELKSFY